MMSARRHVGFDGENQFRAHQQIAIHGLTAMQIVAAILERNRDGVGLDVATERPIEFQHDRD